MDLITVRSMDRFLHLMEVGINNLLTILIMASYLPPVKVHLTMVLPRHLIQVRHEEDTMAKAMVVLKPM